MRLLNLYFTKSLSNFFCRTPGKELCSSRKLSDFYTLSQIKLPENHTLNSSTYLYSLYIGVFPPLGAKMPCTANMLFLFVFRVGLSRFRGRDPSWKKLYQTFKRDQSGRSLTLFEPSKIHSNALLIMQVRAVLTPTMIIVIKCLYKSSYLNNFL